MRTDVDVVPVDPRDDAAFAAWFAVLEADQRHARPGEIDDLPHEQRLSALEGAEPGGDHLSVLLAARAHERTLGAVRIDVPLRDNPHLVEATVVVHPGARRNGIGRQLAKAVESLARQHGRSTVVTFADEPPAELGCSLARLAARRLGYEVAQQELRRDIDLPLDPARAAGLLQICAPGAGGYRVCTWQERCPDALVDDRAALSRHMSLDVPMDELDFREEAWDAARVRRRERRTQAMDRTLVCGGAVDEATGRLVAFTELAVPRSAPTRAFQWDTIVLQAHRGHRLGTLVKLAALQVLSEVSPRSRYVSTWNAAENAHMIAVNDALGARVNGGAVSLQKRLGA